jgi:hypothetical protein
MPRQESATSVRNPVTGPENVQRTRVKAGIAMEMKEQRISSLGDQLLLYLGHAKSSKPKSWRSTPPPSGARQVKQANGKTFN